MEVAWACVLLRGLVDAGTSHRRRDSLRRARSPIAAVRRAPCIGGSRRTGEVELGSICSANGRTAEHGAARSGRTRRVGAERAAAAPRRCGLRGGAGLRTVVRGRLLARKRKRVQGEETLEGHIAAAEHARMSAEKAVKRAECKQEAADANVWVKGTFTCTLLKNAKITGTLEMPTIRSAIK